MNAIGRVRKFRILINFYRSNDAFEYNYFCFITSSPFSLTNVLSLVSSRFL